MSESRATLSLVLLPGLDGTGELFAPFLEAWPDEIATRVVTYPPDRVVSRAELLARIRSTAAETPDHVLVAESFSGALAIEHAAARPPGLRGLVLVASFARNPLPRGMRWAAYCARSWMLPWPPPDSWVRRLLLGSGAPEARLMELRAALRSVERAVIADRIRQLARVDVIDPLLRIAVPVLYLAGRRDRLVGPRGLRPIVRARPEVPIEVLDAPHLVLQTRPIEAVGAIRRFLEVLPEVAS